MTTTGLLLVTHKACAADYCDREVIVPDGAQQLRATVENDGFKTIRRAPLIGATATLALIGASLLVSTLEQLRERQRLLAVLVAFGIRVSVLGLSVLWQTAVPVVLGLTVAVVGGPGLGAALLKMVHTPFYILCLRGSGQAWASLWTRAPPRMMRWSADRRPW
ncbi:FtsX-like permease family protein [Streptomyces sp. NPDC048231]|uniref:FtsX-like permease family protein n=1 Tax=unclassified Streptomyces TaxID=2593676 RepID=UPI0036B1168F